MINYPNKKKQIQKAIVHANLGMTLEKDIDLTNDYYREQKIAIIHKKPTPIQVVDVSYPARNKAKITEAYYKTPSTTDYNGVYKGKYIDFDAKETNSATAMPLSNIHPHQVTHLKEVVEAGGFGFLLVHFKKRGKYFLLPSDILFEFWDNKERNRKSIPYQAFLDRAYEIKFTLNPRLDYLKVVEHLISNN